MIRLYCIFELGLNDCIAGLFLQADGHAVDGGEGYELRLATIANAATNKALFRDLKIDLLSYCTVVLTFLTFSTLNHSVIRYA